MPIDPRDELFQQALDESRDSADVADAELASLLDTAEALRASGAIIGDEASAAQPAAQARFTRYLAQQQTGVESSALPRSWWRRPAGRAGAGLAFAGALAAVIVLTFVVLPSLSGDVETAVAQVLTPGDVVQVEGVVQSTPEAGANDVQVVSDFGDLTVRLNDASLILESDEPVERTDLRPGDRIVVSGIVDRERRVTASALEIRSRDQATPAEFPLMRLDNFQEAFDARMVAFAMSEDGQTVRIVLADGERRLLAERPVSEVQSLFAGGRSIGQDIRVRPPEPGGDRPFRLEGPPGGIAPERGLVGVRGVVADANDGVLTVATLDGRLRVRLTDDTAIRFGASGLDRESFDEGRGAIGHGIGASGRLDPGSGEVLAHVVLLGAIAGPGRR